MTVAAALFALGAAIVAALCAFADGALLGIDDEETHADPRVRELLERRERAHRALAFGRIIAHDRSRYGKIFSDSKLATIN